MDCKAEVTIGLNKLVEAQRIQNWVKRANKDEFAPLEYCIGNVEVDGYEIICEVSSFSENNLDRQLETFCDYVKGLKGTDSFEADVWVRSDGVSWFKDEE